MLITVYLEKIPNFKPEKQHEAVWKSMEFQKYISKEEARQKLKHYCGYQERCHADVKEKLYDLKVNAAFHGELISSLIEEDFLNEERFAKMYAGGKFRINKWGKVKIQQQLKQKQISDYCIKKALAEIDEEEYGKIFNKHAVKKLESLKAGNQFEKASKVSSFLYQKGFEGYLIQGFIQEKLKGNSLKK